MYMKHYRLFLTALAAVFSLGLSAQLQDGGVYWIQDAATGQFISQGSSWGTRATVKDVGGIGFEAVFVSEGKYKLQNVMWNVANDASLGMRADLFTDQASADWELTASGDGYKIGVEGNYLCNNGTPNAIGVKDLGTTEDINSATVWNFLTRAEYDAAIQAYKDEKAAAFAELMGLSGVTNVSSLETAITDPNQFAAIDVTTSITNPTLESNWDGWTHGKTFDNRNEGPGVGQGCAEFWNGCGYATQTIEGLANGLYKLEFVGTFRPKNSGEAEKVASELTSSPAFVSVNDASVEFVHWIDVPAKANNRGAIVSNKDAYNNVIYAYVTDGSLAITVVQDSWYNGYMWCPFGQFKLTYYSDDSSVYKDLWEEALAAAEAAVDNDDYENVTGDELSALNAEIAKAEPTTSAGYEEATAALEAATKAFIAAKSAYDAFVAEKEKAAQFGISATNPSTAEEATAAVEQMMVEEYEVVISEYTTAIELGEWTESGAANFNNEHWSGTTRNYKNQDDSGGKGWNATSWDMSLSQDLALPAGEYVLKVAGRMSAHAFMSLTVKDGDTVLGSVDDFPSKGNTGRGINKEGATSFDADDAAGFSNNNNGSGWEWRYVPFTLTSETTVSIAIEAGARQSHEWASFGDYTVQAKPNIEASLAAYNKAVEAANAAMDANPTVTIGDEYEALEAALSADKGSTIESISEATEAIVAATTAFSSSASAYAAYIAEKAVAEMIGSGTGAEPTTAEEAIAAVQALKEGEYEYVTDNYKFDKTELIGDFPDWDSSATVNGEETDYGTNENEHWSGSPKTYYEQAGAGWGASAWTILFEKTVTLPAGDYMVKVAARASASTVGKMYSSEASTEVALPHNGASTKGIDINGDANFGEGDFVNNGNGFGWEWRYLPISLSEKKSVTITLEVEGKTNYQWASLCDITLLSKQDVPTGITNVGSENANAAKDIYNLQGQKVGKAQKGVFIMNGKKVVVK